TDYKGILLSVNSAVPGTNPLQTTSRFQNAADGTIDGFELEGSILPIQYLTLTGSIGYVRGKYGTFQEANIDRSDQPYSSGLGAYPNTSYSLGATYLRPLRTGDLRVQFNYAYRGKTYSYLQPLTPNPAPGAA